MPKPIHTKPPISAWLIRERKRAGMKPAEVAARLVAMGLPVQEGTVRTWEAGRTPSQDNIEGLQRIFGAVAPQTSDLLSLTEALERQTAVLSELAAQVKALVDSQVSPAELASAIGDALAVREALQAGTPDAEPLRT